MYYVLLRCPDFRVRESHTTMNTSVQLRDVEKGDLPSLFKHQRDPEAVVMVVFQETA